MSVFILHRYASISCDALGGCQVLFGLNGCGSCGGLFLKKYFNLLDLSKRDTDSFRATLLILLLGTNDRPLVSTFCCVSVSCFEDKFVMYF